MTPTRKEITAEEYEECSSDRCPICDKRFYVMETGWHVSQAYECPHCESLVRCTSIRTLAALAGNCADIDNLRKQKL